MTSSAKVEVRASAAPSPTGAHSQAVAVGGWCFVSGQARRLAHATSRYAISRGLSRSGSMIRYARMLKSS